MTSPTIDIEALKAEGPLGRIQLYLATRAETRGLDKEEIHGFHAGHEREATLAVSDILSLIARTEAAEGEVERLKEAAKARDDAQLFASIRIRKLVAQRDGLVEALTEIARLRTELSGDFSMGSKQSNIARAALSTIKAGGGADV